MRSTSNSDSDVASSAPLEPPVMRHTDSDLHIPSWEESWEETYGEEAGRPDSSVVQQQEHEEGSHGDGDDRRAEPKDFLRCALISVAGLVLFVGLLSLTIWSGTLIEPWVVAESLEMESFYVEEGVDAASGVPTKLVSVKCSLMIYIYNSAATFGVRVRSSPVDLFYEDTAIAKGELWGFYLRNSTGRTVSVYLQGENVPLNEAGAHHFPLNSTGSGVVPLRLVLDVVTRGYVLWPVVESKHSQNVSCKVDLDLAKISEPIDLGGKTCDVTTHLQNSINFIS